MRAKKYPQSMLQASFWLDYERDPKSAINNRALAIRVRSPVDAALLERAYQRVSDRHAALRTTFGIERGFPMQYEHDCLACPLRVEDVAPNDAGALADRIRDVLERPVDLEHESASRFALLRAGDDNQVIVQSGNHIVDDLGSVEAIFDEVARLYHAYAAGAGDPDLRPITGSYEAYVDKEAALVAGPEGRELLAYWREALRDVEPVLNLPTDRPRPAPPRHGRHAFIALDEAELRSFKATGASEKASVFRTLLAAYFVFLSRYTGRHDLLVGTPTDRRGRDFAGVLGNFANMVVVRGRPAAGVTFRELVGQVRDAVRGAVRHGDYPFIGLVEKLAPARTGDYAPLFQTNFAFGGFPLRAELSPAFNAAGNVPWRANFAGWEVSETVPYQQQSCAPTDFDLLANEVGGQLVVQFYYNAHLFDGTMVATMAEFFRALLREVGTRPDARLDALSPGGDVDAGRQRSWNYTPSLASPDACVHHLVEAQVFRTPDATAVEGPDGSFTYRQIDERAERLARRLRAVGVGPDRAVALCARRPVDLVVSVLGILKAGGAYVPLDADTPAERLRAIFARVRPAALVSERGLLTGVEGFEPPRVLVNDDHDDTPVTAAAAVMPRDLAYILFTSGSTGEPKGVAVEHRSVVNYLQHCRNTYLADGGNVPLVSPLTFDLTVTSLFLPLICGKAILTQRGPLGGPGDALVESVENDRSCALVKLTPAHLDLLTPYTSSSDANGWTRCLVVGGEALSPALAARWMKAAPSTAIFNEYGPTEATVGCCFHRVEWRDAERVRVPIGRPIANTSLYVLDESLAPVPVGVVAELYVGGVGLARGYVGRPAATAERFVPNPFAVGERLYRTGDRVRRLADGSLDYLGRLDRQVKMRGYRIELGEIEATLRTCAGVREAFVLVDDGTQDEGRRLVAYVSGGAGVPPTEGGVLAELKRRLPAYLVPTRVVVLDTLPLTAHGKVDLGALAAPAGGRTTRLSPRRAPESHAERLIAAAWTKALGTDDFGVDDSFFDLGGTSLMVVRVAHEISGALGVDVRPGRLLQLQTIAGLASALSAQDEGDRAPLIALNKASSARAPLFCLRPPGGDLGVYAPLAEALGEVRPLLGVDAYVDGADSLERLVTHFAGAIAERQPDGPVALLGWSSGGVLAFETARQLESLGRRVAFLGLIDTRLFAQGDAFAQVVAELGDFASALSRLDDGILRHVLEDLRAAPPGTRLARARARAREVGLDVGETDEGGGPALANAQLALVRAYTPRPVRADLHVWYARVGLETFGRSPWNELTSGNYFESVIDANHYTLIDRSHVGALAAAMSGALASAFGTAS